MANSVDSGSIVFAKVSVLVYRAGRVQWRIKINLFLSYWSSKILPLIK